MATASRLAPCMISYAPIRRSFPYSMFSSSRLSFVFRGAHFRILAHWRDILRFLRHYCFHQFAWIGISSGHERYRKYRFGMSDLAMRPQLVKDSANCKDGLSMRYTPVARKKVSRYLRFARPFWVGGLCDRIPTFAIF